MEEHPVSRSADDIRIRTDRSEKTVAAPLSFHESVTWPQP